MHHATIPAAILGLCILAAAALHAGPLNPPAGPVASSYKTLSEVEPRIAINATNTPGDAGSTFKITQPGAYYLSGNVTGVSAKAGIVIAADNVTLDLDGFALLGVAGSLDGIATDAAHRNLTIRNGTIAGWGQDGIDLTQGVIAGTFQSGSLLENVQASNCSARGIVTGVNSVLKACQAIDNNSEGIHVGESSSISSCLAYSNTGIGYSISAACTLVNCSADGNTGGGYRLLGGSSIHHCSAYSNGTAGIFTQNSGILIEDCTCSFNSAPGISIGGSGNTTVRACQCYQNASNPGILVTVSDCRIEGNNCTTNGTGIRITGSGNIVIRNTFRTTPPITGTSRPATP